MAFYVSPWLFLVIGAVPFIGGLLMVLFRRQLVASLWRRSSRFLPELFTNGSNRYEVIPTIVAGCIFVVVGLLFLAGGIYGVATSAPVVPRP